MQDAGTANRSFSFSSRNQQPHRLIRGFFFFFFLRVSFLSSLIASRGGSGACAQGRRLTSRRLSIVGEGIIAETSEPDMGRRFPCVFDLAAWSNSFCFSVRFFLGYRHHLCHSTLFTKWNSHFVPRTKDNPSFVVGRDGLITWEV